MRSTSLRLILLAGAALAAWPAAAQDAPAIRIDPAPLTLRELVPPSERPPTAPDVVIAPGEPSPADAVPPAVPAESVAAPAAPAPDPNWSPAATDAEGRSVYGLYLSGRLAGMRGDRALSADYLARSQALAPDQPKVADEAFRAALFSGDIDAVARLTPEVTDTPILAEPGRLFGVVQALREGDGLEALSRLNAASFTPPFNLAAGYLTPVVSAAGGAWDVALAPVTETGAAHLVLAEQRAQLLEARRQYDEADAQYRALTESADGKRFFGVRYGAFLERRGRREEAITSYRGALTPPAPDPRALSALRRIEAGGRAPEAPRLTAIAADALSFAALQASAGDGEELAVIYLQMADALADDDSITLRLGQSLARSDHKALAIDAFARVTQTNPIQYAAAQVGLAQLLQDDGRDEDALAALERADQAAPNQPELKQRRASLLIDMNRPADALTLLGQPTVNTADQPLEFRMLRGVALSRLDRLEEAEAELWAALQGAPDNPFLLNQLGYIWVDSGRRIDQGAEMLARAHAASPENGNIQDSLGWAQYRQGQYDAAVENLEQAVAKEPANAEINDHLGDAYWKVGRRREAEWQWSRVLTLDPDAERRASVARKLQEGLPIAVAVIDSAPSAGPVGDAGASPGE